MFPLNVLPSTRLLVALISSHAPVSGGTAAFGSPPLPVMTLFTTQLLLPMLILNPSSGFPIEMFPMKLFDADDSLMINPLCLPAGLDGGSAVITRLNSRLITTGSPVHLPCTRIVLVGAEADVLVLATTATASDKLLQL